jgi:hypothetical protein
MRGSDERTGALFSYVDVESRIRSDQASGTAEREAALAMLDRRTRRRRITLGADKPVLAERLPQAGSRRGL